MTGVPAGAVLISLSELEQRAPDELTLDMPVYVICSADLYPNDTWCYSIDRMDGGSGDF